MAFKEQADLKKRWQLFRTEHPQTRIRNAAEQLGVSEAELLATDAGESTVLLNNRFEEILREIETLGRVMALTRNDSVVHERKGEYKNIEFFDAHGKMGLVLGEDIDLRIFLKNWNFAFAVKSENSRGQLRSLQFFDSYGTAVHKIFLTDASDIAAYENLVNKYRRDNQHTPLEIFPKPEKSPEKADSDIDVKSFRQSWAQLKDTHDFFPMLRKFGVSREQSLRLADPEMAFQVPTAAYQDVLNKASNANLPVMIFVGNEGIIQIHTGAIENISEARGWFNVLDEKFNLHIKQDEIKSSWVVRKPTGAGIVSSLEIFNKKGENVALFFGVRKPGVPENHKWRELLGAINCI